MTGKRVLITGGSGFIGSSLVRRLVLEGFAVRVFDDDSRGRTQRLGAVANDIEMIPGDIRDSSAVERACRGIDVVFHLAAVNGTEFFYSKPEQVLEVGVKGMLNIIDACTRHGVPELLLASSSEVYQSPPRIPTDENVPLTIPDPANPRYSYAGSKIISELLVINYGRRSFERVLIFRPHNVYGPDMGWEHVIPQLTLRMRELARSSEGPISLPVQGSGRETRAFIFIEDAVDAVMLLLRSGMHLGIYNIGTEDEIAIADLARLVGDYFGRAVTVAEGPRPSGGTERRCPDISRLRALGFRAHISLQDGVRRTADWYDRNAHLRPAR